MSNDEQQREINIPKLRDFSQKKIFCPACSNEVPWEKTLEAGPCPSCARMLYYPKLVGKYLLYKPLGIGGIGHVFKALRQGESARFAVKILPAEKSDNPLFREHLIREARSGAAVGAHPNLISVVEYGEEPETPYLVMPFIAGERLDAYIQRKKHISETRALNIVRQIIEAELHVLSCGYLYRDLKPENILLEKNGNVRLFDYGLCIPKSEAVAKDFVPDEFEGSPLYIPPERIVGASEGEYSEIYSLGMILFHMLKGRPYFTETEINDLIAKHVSFLRTLSVQAYLKNCSRQLTAIIDKMIARKPDMRYLDFISLKEDIEKAVRESSLIASVSLKMSEKQ